MRKLWSSSKLNAVSINLSKGIVPLHFMGLENVCSFHSKSSISSIAARIIKGNFRSDSNRRIEKVSLNVSTTSSSCDIRLFRSLVLSNNVNLDGLSHAEDDDSDSVKLSFEDIISRENYIQSHAKSKRQQSDILSNTRQSSVSTQPHAEPSTSISRKPNE